MSRIRVTICELPDKATAFQAALKDLAKHVKDERSDLVLINELPAHPWLCHLEAFDAKLFHNAMTAHDTFVNGLRVFSPATVLSARPAESAGRRFVQGFAWDAKGGYRPAHNKAYLPDEEGFYEARWFHSGGPSFEPFRVGPLSVGFQICTEAMFNEWARHYGRRGVQLIAAPRAGGNADRWQIALRMAAVASGAYVASSNRTGPAEDPRNTSFGGQGWIIGPEGEVLAKTMPEAPFATAEIDTQLADAAKRSYPRDVAELASSALAKAIA